MSQTRGRYHQRQPDDEVNRLCRLNRLPHEVLLQILHKLNPPDLVNVSRVNLTLEHLVSEPSLWRHVSFWSVKSPIRRSVVRHLTPFLIHTTVLDLSAKCCRNLTETDIQRMCRRCELLTWLSCSYNTGISADGLKTIVSSCGRLRHVGLNGCLGVDSSAVKQLARLGAGLRSLEISNCPRIDDDALVHLAAACPCLETLELRGCCHVTSFGLGAIFRNCADLRILDIKGTGVQISTLHQTISQDNRLEELTIGLISDMTSVNSINRLLLRSSRLRVISFSIKKDSKHSLSRIEELQLIHFFNLLKNLARTSADIDRLNKIAAAVI